MSDTTRGVTMPALTLNGLLLSGLLFSAPVLAEGMKVGNTEFSFSGYVKLDVMYSEYSDGDVPAASIGRDYFYTNTIPVNAAPGMDDSHSFLDMHAKQSRIVFKTKSDIGGEIIGTHFEFDFNNSPGGNEVVSNSYSPRLRQAYFTWREWLFGQTWSTFQNVAALPETIDFIGPAESTVFIRQSQVRYTHGPWQFSVENPETVALPNGGGATVTTDDNVLPDLVGRYNLGFAGGSDLSIAVLAHSLAVDDSIPGVDDEVYGYGVSAAGTVKLGADDIKWMLNYGDGVGRYVGVGVLPGAVVDDDGDLETISSVSGYIAYRHFWTPQWRTQLVYGVFEGDADTDLTGEAVNASAQSAHVNLLYSPNKALTFGVEYLYASRELENGEDGDLNRVQFGAKYAF